MLKQSNQDFEDFVVPTKSFTNTHRQIMAAIRENGFLAITGEPGMGKSFLKEMTVRSLREKKARFEVVDFLAMTRDHDISTAIMKLMIDTLSSERSRADIIARTTQLSRILREVSRNKKIVLAIDEAQNLHYNTLYSLKKLHEFGREGDSCFTILLFGHPHLSQMIAPRELSLRISVHEMEYLTTEETVEFLKHWGMSIPDKTAFSEFYIHSGRLPLSIKYAVKKMKSFMEEGETKATKETVNKLICGNMTKKIFDLGGYSRFIKWMHVKTGQRFDKSTVSKSLNGTSFTQTSNNIRSLAAEFIEEETAAQA